MFISLSKVERVGPAKKREALAMCGWQHFFAFIFLCLLSFEQAKESKDLRTDICYWSFCDK